MKTILITYLILGLIPNIQAFRQDKNIISIWRKHYLLYSFFALLNFIFWPIVFFKPICQDVKSVFKKKVV